MVIVILLPYESNIKATASRRRSVEGVGCTRPNTSDWRLSDSGVIKALEIDEIARIESPVPESHQVREIKECGLNKCFGVVMFSVCCGGGGVCAHKSKSKQARESLEGQTHQRAFLRNHRATSSGESG